jgi:hypothetical protein
MSLTVAKHDGDDDWAICGKIEQLHKHLVGCDHVSRAARHRAYMGRGAPGGRKRHGSKSRVDHPDMDTDPVLMVDGTQAPLPPGEQDWFDSMLCRAAISAGWSWNSLNDPEVVKMMTKLRPDLHMPDRRVLSGRILNGEVEKAVEELRSSVIGRIATGSCDGWKNVSKTSLVASMITVDYKVCIYSPKKLNKALNINT